MAHVVITDSLSSFISSLQQLPLWLCVDDEFLTKNSRTQSFQILVKQSLFFLPSVRE